MTLNIDGVEYTLTHHARYRMEKRSVSMCDLLEALSNIKFTRKQTNRKDEEERILITGRNQVNVVITKTNVIVTIYSYKRAHHESKRKQSFNKKRRAIKKKVGNRFKR